MKHVTLGDITRDGTNGDGVARVPYSDRTINIRIIADELSYEETVDIAVSVVQQLEQLDAKAKQIAAAELTDTYNAGWNEYDEAQEDGTFKAVSNPKLSQKEFVSPFNNSFRRRSPTRQARWGIGKAETRQSQPVHPRRTDDRSALCRY